MASEAELRELYTAAGQAHVFAFWDACSAEEREQLLAQLRQIDPHAMNEIFRALPQGEAAVEDAVPAAAHASVARASAEELAAWEAAGLQAVARGEVALVLLAGGQGTRLGSADPKGMYDIGLPSGKSLFQLQAERIGALRRLAAARFGDAASPAALPWYIMTSDATHEKTVAYFEAHGHFGLPAGDVAFFRQGWLPVLSPPSGALLLESRCRVAAAPDGNGGVFAALRAGGALADMAARGVRDVHAYCVDNALVRPGDPHLLGFCRLRGAPAGAKVIPRAAPDEAVGVFAAAPGGGVRVLEYSELPPALAAAPRADGGAGLAFDAANIALHYFSLPFLQRCAGVGAAPVRMPYHAALKKVPCVSACGTEAAVPPRAPNGVKLEAFIFDVYPAAGDGAALLEGARDDDFAPVKNAPGALRDSPDTARALLCAQHRRWAAAAGARVAGEGGLELSAALTYAGEGLGALAGRALDAPWYLTAL